ncbi:Zn-ribbon domain-containing OB-fold protein [Salinilacihabitans rarus]|uniref:Zn-ribbon domain-containing OB-fold protein n=1 Tax=Salinilacihabitans rarus TaxID=2961596 RepID=UPI0020C90A4F|nr:OB-fold domain-containing protein [Salinilacihabitans rarus]
MSDDRLTHAEWTAAIEDGDLLGQRCPDCGHETAAPKAACARCGSREVETVSLPTEGVVHTATTIAVAPEGFEGPYRVAVIDLGEARVLARLDGDAGIGDAVELAGAVDDRDEPAPLFS